MKSILVLAFLTALLPLSPLQRTSPPVFSPEERSRVVALWSAAGRQTVSVAPSTKTKGVFQVRLTPEASNWFWRYQKALTGGAGKPPPTLDVKGTSGDAVSWETWVAAQVEHDRWKAQTDADRLNTEALPDWKPLAASEPPSPSAPPTSLVTQVGLPPPFAAAVAPRFYTITFPDGDVYTYETHPVMRPRYAYYRFDQGTVNYGLNLKDLPDAELDSLFARAGFSKGEQKVAKFVSRLEGGFDAINTYDTGFVSVGFLQFITAEDGTGSLASVLLQEKRDTPLLFQKDFRAYGIEVTPGGVLCVLDPETGAELTGADAVQKVIADKRLTAVFQKAGRRSTAFQTAQIGVAKAQYWPLEDSFTVNLNPADPATSLTCKVGDIIKSEAGMATLFDRKVNRGSVLPFPDVVKAVMTKYKLKSVSECCAYEREIVAALKYRSNFLAEAALTQPPSPSLAPPLPADPSPELP